MLAEEETEKGENEMAETEKCKILYRELFMSAHPCVTSQFPLYAFV